MANDIVWDDEKPGSDGIIWDDEKPKAAAPQTNTLGQEAARQLGLTGRALVSAAASPVTLVGDAIGKGINALTGSETIKPYSERLQGALTAMGVPEPRRPIEQFTQGVSEAAPAFALPATLPAQVVGNAAIAATQARPGEELGQAALGGALGAGGQALARTVGGIVRPTADARQLMDAGVALTPGQAAGVGSFANKAEQWMASNPVASHFVTGAQRRAVEESNRAAAQSVARMVDDKAKLGLPPREAIEQTRDLISGAYHQSLEGMSWPSNALANDIRASMREIPTDLPLTPAKTINQIETYLTQRLGPWVKQGGDLTGDQLKQVDAEMGQMARNLANSPNTTEKVQAPAWREVQSYVRNAMEHAAATPEQHALLSKANAAYRQLLALEKAMLPGHETFTPRRLKMTLDRMGIKGTDLNRVANAMDKTLPNTVPNSGTAERVIANALPAMLMGGGAGASGLGWDTVGAGMMAAGALGSRPGARMMTGGYSAQPYAEAAIRSLRRGIPGVTRQQPATEEE